MPKVNTNGLGRHGVSRSVGSHANYVHDSGTGINMGVDTNLKDGKSITFSVVQPDGVVKGGRMMGIQAIGEKNAITVTPLRGKHKRLRPASLNASSVLESKDEEGSKEVVSNKQVVAIPKVNNSLEAVHGEGNEVQGGAVVLVSTSLGEQ